jgi:mRNA interferase RelE/StbE
VRRYDLTFAPKAVRSLGKLDRHVAQRLREVAEALCDDPRPSGARMLTGMHGVWRVRVAKDYRIVYQVDDGLLVILVVDAGHRREIYR